MAIWIPFPNRRYGYGISINLGCSYRNVSRTKRGRYFSASDFDRENFYYWTNPIRRQKNVHMLSKRLICNIRISRCVGICTYIPHELIVKINIRNEYFHICLYVCMYVYIPLID